MVFNGKSCSSALCCFLYDFLLSLINSCVSWQTMSRDEMRSRSAVCCCLHFFLVKCEWFSFNVENDPVFLKFKVKHDSLTILLFCTFITKAEIMSIVRHLNLIWIKRRLLCALHLVEIVVDWLSANIWKYETEDKLMSTWNSFSFQRKTLDISPKTANLLVADNIYFISNTQYIVYSLCSHKYSLIIIFTSLHTTICDLRCLYFNKAVGKGRCHYMHLSWTNGSNWHSIT